MATERITVTMEQAALAAARAGASRDGVSLSEWLSRAAWTRAVEQAARVSAEQDRQHASEFEHWDAVAVDKVFGQDAA